MLFMDVKEVLRFVDHLVVEKTGKHLDDIQKAIIEGTWQRQSYHNIAEKYHVTEGYTGDVASELWKLLSEVLGEDIKKSNFRSTLERIYINSPQNICIGTNHNNNFNSGLQTINQSNQQDQQSNINKKLYYHDLTFAPKIIKFYNRETELKTLSNWIFNQNIPLISVLGLSGLGKTNLIKKFIDLNLDQFEVIIWRSLKYPKNLELLINDFLNICKEEIKEILDDKLKQLLEILIEKKCLIILDDVQNLFIRGKFAGQYKAEYQDYQNFLKMITETNHQSNLVLISQEQCTEMVCLDEELYPIKCLELSGLFDIELLKNWGLKDEDSWYDLITLYEGNLFYLKSIAMLINNNYDGQVADFLAENSLLITNQMQSHFRDIFNYLSPPEQEIVLQLSKLEQAITRDNLRQSLNLSSVDFNNGLQSLQKRYLVKKIKEDKVRFKLSNVFKEYVINYCKSNN